MEFEDGTGKVKADRRKGILRITKDNQGMQKLQWCDYETKNPMEELFVFPGEFKFEKIKQVPGRVYLVSGVNSSLKRFYYMQEPD